MATVRDKWVQSGDKKLCVDSCEGSGFALGRECVPACPDTHVWSAKTKECVQLTQAAYARYFFSNVLGSFAVPPAGSESWPVATPSTQTSAKGPLVQESCTDLEWTNWVVKGVRGSTDAKNKLQCVKGCPKGTFDLFGQCVAACPTQKDWEQLSYRGECVVGRNPTCTQQNRVVVGHREFCTSDCAGYTVLTLAEDARASCVENVPENTRAWRSGPDGDSVWITESCTSFAAYCVEATAAGGMCMFGLQDAFAEPLELAGQCVDENKQGCVYLVSREEREVVVGANT